MNNLFLIDKIDGLSLEFSKLISMMNYTRETTLVEVMDLSNSQLDFLINEKANSIGMLLAHMVAVEKAYQIDTIEKRELTEADMYKLNPALTLGKPAQEQIKGNTIDFYVEQLDATRKKTIESFQILEDAWLFEQTSFWGAEPANNYFKWFHVFEDELNHRGQIRLIKKIMELSAK